MAQPFPSLQGEGLGVGSVTSTLAADKDTNPAPFPSPTGAGGAAVYFFADFQTATVGIPTVAETQEQWQNPNRAFYH